MLWLSSIEAQTMAPFRLGVIVALRFRVED
jgi:hypothetical protein